MSTANESRHAFLVNAAFDVNAGADNFRPGYGAANVYACAAVVNADLTTQAVITGTHQELKSGGATLATFTLTIPSTAVAGEVYVNEELNLIVRPGEEIAFTVSGGTAAEVVDLSIWIEDKFEMNANNIQQIEVTV